MIGKLRHQNAGQQTRAGNAPLDRPTWCGASTMVSQHLHAGFGRTWRIMRKLQALIPPSTIRGRVTIIPRSRLAALYPRDSDASPSVLDSFGASVEPCGNRVTLIKSTWVQGANMKGRRSCNDSNSLKRVN